MTSVPADSTGRAPSGDVGRELTGLLAAGRAAGVIDVTPRGAWFLFLPLNLVDGTGAPGRALAVLP